jgi:hypothetical protein
MEADRPDAIDDLLVEAEKAHGAYEAEQLNGVYDEAWPRWYAAYIVEHGLPDLLGHEADAPRVAAFLEEAFADFERLDPKPAEPWSSYIAGRMAADL